MACLLAAGSSFGKDAEGDAHEYHELRARLSRRTDRASEGLENRCSAFHGFICPLDAVSRTAPLNQLNKVRRASRAQGIRVSLLAELPLKTTAVRF